jgi:hypothetical protein
VDDFNYLSPSRRHTYRNNSNNFNPTPTPPPNTRGGNNNRFGTFGEGEKNKEGDGKTGEERDESVASHGGSQEGSQGGNQSNDRKRKGSSKKKGGKGNNGKKTKEDMEKIDEEVENLAEAVEKTGSNKKQSDNNKGKKEAERDGGDDDGKESSKKKGKKKKLGINKFGQGLKLLVKLSTAQEKVYSHIRYKISKGDLVTMDDFAEIEGSHNQLSLLVGAVNLRMHDIALSTKDLYHPDNSFSFLRFVSKAKLPKVVSKSSTTKHTSLKASRSYLSSAQSSLLTLLEKIWLKNSAPPR